MSDFDSLIAKFARNNNLTLEPEEGRYTIRMPGVKISCHSNTGRVWLEADLGAMPEGRDDRQAMSRRLAEKNLGLIRDQRVCLSVDKERSMYCLHQRLPLDDLRPEVFQETLEEFGGCHQFLKSMMQNTVSGSGPNPMMMP